MDRPDFAVIPADTAWLTDPAARAVCEALGADQVFMVGGCVRDALLRLNGSDVDMATPLTPQEVVQRAEAAGLKTVPTGINHGTITVVAQGAGFEVTTFRQDVDTDGRRATVAFSTDIAQDARRRDFTLNALYATPEGRIIDPLGGLPDCLARRIRFIENAQDRIREDYLRVLRFFRFHAWYADPENGFDAEALDAIASNTDGLERLSAERVGMEMRKLLAAPNPVPAVAVMHQSGVLSRVLPGGDPTLLGPVVHLEERLNRRPDWRLRLAALGGSDVQNRLRLSSKDAKVLAALKTAMGEMTPTPEIAYRQGFDIAASVVILRAALANESVDLNALEPLKTAASARFPIRAQDLMPALSGKALGARLEVLEQRWIASDFRLTREELMTSE
ncbi:CCA tRNA nucleotidyltransferase [uncultured Roseobacter sp.]|uniref:CCA tRNA nucleotidyltransferase n=1 Tax=uncultured Roseobacter sp. TaxID=114847 RepID=UPI002615C1B7|nr:CCA tRNA nucleotidyltransferase [uncultured Roseobacter sp.]